MARASVDNQIYDTYGDRWYTAQDDPVALLRAESRTKVPWVLKKLHENQISQGDLLDVGCGAGFLSNALAQEGFSVTGIDMSESSLEVAHRHDSTKKVKYITADAYSLPFKNQSFNVVTAMDFLEHVDRPEAVVAEIARVLKPGGAFFYHTFNRSLFSHLVVIKLVEWMVRNTPKDMHVIDLFIKPQELQGFCENHGLKVKATVGIRPRFSTIPLKNYFTGVVPESLEFKITGSKLLSYMGYALKEL